MATKVTGIILDTAVLDRITTELKPKARKIVNKYGLVMAGDAAKIAPRDPARPPQDPSQPVTGSLRNTIVSESHMEGDLTFILQDGVEYGVFQELGTSKIPARPFFTPTIEKWRDRFLKAFEELFK